MTPDQNTNALVEKAQPTHYCVVCAARWTRHEDGTWSLASDDCGSCCDNVPTDTAPIVELQPDGTVNGRDYERVKGAYDSARRQEQVDRYRGVLCALCDAPFERHGDDWSCPRRVKPRFTFPAEPILPPTTSAGDAQGWLVETDFGPHVHYIGLCDPHAYWREQSEKGRSLHGRGSLVGIIRFCKDANDACRFARKEDAQQLVDALGQLLVEPRICEHMWPTPSSAGDGELVGKLNDAWLRGMSDARRLAVENSNYGHVEGNKRAFKIVAEIEYRMNAAGSTSDETIAQLTARVKELEEALRPFAEYADPRGTIPASHVLTAGSSMARRQLTMGDCYTARSALNPSPTVPGEQG